MRGDNGTRSPPIAKSPQLVAGMALKAATKESLAAVTSARLTSAKKLESCSCQAADNRNNEIGPRHHALLARVFEPLEGILRQEGSCMAPSRLRVYYGPEEESLQTLPTTIPMREEITLPLGEVLPLVLDAVRNRRMWVEDFADDQITISSDLYEVLLAYQHFRRPSA
jgi:hypothetical protein